MITCSRCHHQNPETLSACELCSSPFDDAQPADPDGGLGEEMLSVDDLEALVYDVDVDESLEPPSDLKGDVEEIQFDEDPPDLFGAVDKADADDQKASLPASSAPSAPQGLARLLQDALAGDGGNEEVAEAHPTVPIEVAKVAKIASPPASKIAENISDQELSEFLLDALSDTDAPPSIEAPAIKPGASSTSGLFKMPDRAAPGRANTMEIPGIPELAAQDALEIPESATLAPPAPESLIPAESSGAPLQTTEPGARAVGVQCGNCGGFNPEGMYYCVYCGFSLESSNDEEEEEAVAEPESAEVDASACPSCGTLNPNGNRFCGSCGYKINGPPEAAEIDPRITSGSSRSTTDATRKASTWDVKLISINEDGTDGLEIPLDFIKTVVGRTGDTRFPTDAFLSPKHACLTIEDSELYIEDLYSLNGTFVKLRDEVPLSPGDVFLMGRQVLRFEKFEQTITPKARSSDGTRYMGSPPPGGQYKLLQIGIGGVIQNVYCIPDSGAVLGREKGDIIFPRDKFMSGRHAQIYPREDGTNCLVDLNSSNGTWIKIWEKTPLKDGDFIFMGQQLFRIEINGPLNR